MLETPNWTVIAILLCYTVTPASPLAAERQKKIGFPQILFCVCVLLRIMCVVGVYDYERVCLCERESVCVCVCVYLSLHDSNDRDSVAAMWFSQVHKQFFCRPSRRQARYCNHILPPWDFLTTEIMAVSYYAFLALYMHIKSSVMQKNTKKLLTLLTTFLPAGVSM